MQPSSSSNSIQERFLEQIRGLKIRFIGKEIEQKTGYSKGTISAYLKENGSASKDFITDVAEKFDLDIEYILSGEKSLNVQPDQPLGKKVAKQSAALFNRTGVINADEVTFTRQEEIEMRIISYTLANLLVVNGRGQIEQMRAYRIEQCMLDAREYYKKTLELQ